MTDDRKPSLREVALLASQRIGGLQGRALDRAAKKRGLTLSYTTVDKIIAGTYNSRPSNKTLEALADLAGIPLDQVYEAAGLPMATVSLAEQLPPDADLLTDSQRRVIIDTVRVFTKQNRELDQARRDLKECIETPQHPSPQKPTSDDLATWDLEHDPEIEAITATKLSESTKARMISEILRKRKRTRPPGVAPDGPQPADPDGAV